jgi:hypothetical protein
MSNRKFAQRTRNKAFRKDAREALRRGDEPRLVNRRQVDWDIH